MIDLKNLPIHKYEWRAPSKQPKNPRRLSAELLKIFLLWLAISPLNQAISDFILFHPSSDVSIDERAIKVISQRYGATWTDELFTAPDGTKLSGWYFNSPKAKKTILVSHGNGGNIAHRILLIASLVHCGGSVFVYDYRGYGKSAGKASVDGIQQDGLAAYDFLTKEKNVRPSDIVLYGESLGCAVSSNIFSKRPVGGVILQSGFSSIQTAARDRLPWMWLYPDQLYPQRSLTNMVAYRGAHPPLLIMHGEQDSILFPQYSKEVFAAASEPKQLVMLPTCGHNDVFLNDMKLCTGAVQRFLQKLPEAPEE
jgi:Putative lysophospholipase.